MKGLIEEALKGSAPPTQTEQEKKFEPADVRIAVVGVGGGGTNTVNRLTKMGIESAEKESLLGREVLLDPRRQIFVVRRIVPAENDVALGQVEVRSHDSQLSLHRTASLVGDGAPQVVGNRLFQVLEKEISRCTTCNGVLVIRQRPDSVTTSSQKIKILDDQAWKNIPQGVKDRNLEFWRCEACHQVYWRGTHWKDIEATRQKLLTFKEE